MQLKTVSKSSPQMRTPSIGNLTIHSSPQVMLVHLVAKPIPLVLQITGQEAPQKLVCLGFSLIMSLWGFFEHLLGLDELQLVGLLILLGTQTLGLFSRVLANLSTVLASFLHCTSSPFCSMRHRTAATYVRQSLVFHREKMVIPLGSLTFILSKDSLVVTRSIGGTYRIGEQLLSCPFLHLESSNPLGLLKTVVILACCQIDVPSMSLLNLNLGGTRRDQLACMVALEKLQRAKVLVLDSNILILHVLLFG
jgi:hypothetical protein